VTIGDNNLLHSAAGVSPITGGTAVVTSQLL
jgi:hypothetical protein